MSDVLGEQVGFQFFSIHIKSSRASLCGVFIEDQAKFRLPGNKGKQLYLTFKGIIVFWHNLGFKVNFLAF